MCENANRISVCVCVCVCAYVYRRLSSLCCGRSGEGSSTASWSSPESLVGTFLHLLLRVYNVSEKDHGSLTWWGGQPRPRTHRTPRTPLKTTRRGARHVRIGPGVPRSSFAPRTMYKRRPRPGRSGTTTSTARRRIALFVRGGCWRAPLPCRAATTRCRRS